MLTPVEFRDFTGGLTDAVKGGTNQFVTGDNLLYEKDTAQLYSRPGSVLLDAAKPIAARISSLWNFNEDSGLFATSARQLWRWINPGWTEIVGPTGNSFFSAGDNTNRVTGSDWKGHLFLTNDGGALPMKVYQTADGTYKGVTAGLPRFLPVDSYSATTVTSVAFATLANNIRAQMIAHFASATYHPTGADVTSGAGLPAALNGAGGDTFALANTFVNALQDAYNLHFNDARAITGTRLYHSNVLGDFPGEPNLPLEDYYPLITKPNTSWNTLAQRLNDLKKRFNWHIRSYLGHPPSTTLTTQGITFRANTSNGNLSVTVINGVALGAQFTGTDITIQINTGVTTRTQVAALLATLNVFYVIADGSGLYPATVTGGGAALAVAAAIVSVTDLVTAAVLPNTEIGPTFSDLEYANAIAFVNNLKWQYTAHAISVAGTHLVNDGIGPFPPTTAGAPTFMAYVAPLGGAGAVVNTAYWVTLAQASDYDSLMELTAHLYAAYRRHQADAVLPAVIVTGTVRNVTKNIIDGCVEMTTTEDIKGALNPNRIMLGMYVHVAGQSPDNTAVGGGATANQFPALTTVAAINPITGEISTSANHNGATGADEIVDLIFTKRSFHGVVTTAANSPVTAPTGTTDAFHTGDLQTLISLADASLSPLSLYAVLLDIATSFNDHDANVVNYHNPFVVGAAFQVDLTTLLPFHSYIYAWVFSHEYTTMSGENFRVVSAPYFKTKYTTKLPDVLPTSITNMPTIDNGVLNNYDTGNIKLEVYRSQDAGTVPYLVGSVVLGTTTFTDRSQDSELLSHPKLYTSGGAIDSDPPPKASVLHIMKDGTAYYGSTTRTNNDGSIETVVNRVEQAVQDAPEYANAGNFDDLPLAVIGVSSVRSLPVVFTPESVHRLEGTFDLLGRGEIIARSISDRVGLVGPFSPLQVDGAIVFAGSDQYYKTDGYSLVPLGKLWPTTFKTLSATPRNLLGTFDKLTNRAYWTASRAGGESDTLVCLDMNHLTETRAPWTTWSNGTSFVPSALCFFQGDLIRGDSSGYVFRHNAAYTSDPKIVGGTVTAGISKTVVYNLTTTAFNYGTDALRKFGVYLQAKFKNLGNLSAQFISNNDRNRTITGQGNVAAMTPIRSRVAYLIDEKRFFPAGNLWFSDKQVTLTNAKVVVTNSDALGLATVTGTTTVTIAPPGTFPADMVDHVISFAADGYVTEYPITAENGGLNVLTVSGAPANVVGTKWVIRGYPKTEVMQLEEFAVWSTICGANQTDAAGESGANA